MIKIDAVSTTDAFREDLNSGAQLLTSLHFRFCDVPQSPWVVNDRGNVQSPRIGVTTTNGAQVLFPVSWVVTQAPPGLVVINSCKAIHTTHHVSRTD